MPAPARTLCPCQGSACPWRCSYPVVYHNLLAMSSENFTAWWLPATWRTRPWLGLDSASGKQPWPRPCRRPLSVAGAVSSLDGSNRTVWIARLAASPPHVHRPRSSTNRPTPPCKHRRSRVARESGGAPAAPRSFPRVESCERPASGRQRFPSRSRAFAQSGLAFRPRRLDGVEPLAPACAIPLRLADYRWLT
jgi:hypothetical protein